MAAGKVPSVPHRLFALFFTNDPPLHAEVLEGRDYEVWIYEGLSYKSWVANFGNKWMSAPLVVSIPHRLGREEAIRRLKAGLTRAASGVPVLKVDEERWENSRMIFRVSALGQAASGHVDVADDHVRVEVTLPWLLQRFAEVAQAAIRNRGNLLLTKKS
jgi:Putative polyhydroxyalkanoic acid system protein (PHA_gran_rgn)